MDPFLAFFNQGPIGLPELLIIFALVLLVFGPKKLPEIAEAFGRSINKFKSATRTASDEVKKELDDVRNTVDDSDTSAVDKDRSADS